MVVNSKGGWRHSLDPIKTQHEDDIAKLFENFQKLAKVINANRDELEKRDEIFTKALDNHGKRINELFEIINDLLKLFLELRREGSEK